MKFLRSCFAILLLAAWSAFAQESAAPDSATATDTTATSAAATDTAPAAATTTTTTTTTAPPKTGSPDEVAVSRVIFVAGPHADRRIHLGDEVRVGISGYEALRKEAAERQKPVTLWMNGLDSKLERIGDGPFTEPKPAMTADERADARILTFRLSRTDGNKELWRNLLRDPFGEPRESLALSAGISDDVSLRLAGGVDGTLTLQKTRFTAISVFWALVVLVIIALLLRYASEMLRAGPEVNGKKLTYSLARSQMAWWFVLIIASYIVIWLITGDRDTVTTSLLVLMGISAATAMGSVAIDASSDARANEKRKELEAEKGSLQTSPTNMAAQAEAASPHEQVAGAAVDQRIKEIDQTIANITRPSYTTGSWLTDVLTDNNGSVALHRFQVLAWTAVLGFIFLASVFSDLSMPEFNATLLTLMGISSGTYLGFKLPSNGG